jgi:hypothetical protein
MIFSLYYSSKEFESFVKVGNYSQVLNFYQKAIKSLLSIGSKVVEKENQSEVFVLNLLNTFCKYSLNELFELSIDSFLK